MWAWQGGYKNLTSMHSYMHITVWGWMYHSWQSHANAVVNSVLMPVLQYDMYLHWEEN